MSCKNFIWIEIAVVNLIRKGGLKITKYTHVSTCMVLHPVDIYILHSYVLHFKKCVKLNFLIYLTTHFFSVSQVFMFDLICM